MMLELNDEEIGLILDALNDLPDCEAVETLKEKIYCQAIPEDEIFDC